MTIINNRRNVMDDDEDREYGAGTAAVIAD